MDEAVDDGLNEAEERTSEGEHKTHELEEANQARSAFIPEEIDSDESGIDAREGCNQVWAQFAQQLFEFFFDAHS